MQYAGPQAYQKRRLQKMISAAGKAGHQQGIVQSEEVSILDRVFLRGRCLFKVYIFPPHLAIAQSLVRSSDDIEIFSNSSILLNTVQFQKLIIDLSMFLHALIFFLQAEFSASHHQCRKGH